MKIHKKLEKYLSPIVQFLLICINCNITWRWIFTFSLILIQKRVIEIGIHMIKNTNKEWYQYIFQSCNKYVFVIKRKCLKKSWNKKEGWAWLQYLAHWKFLDLLAPFKIPFNKTGAAWDLLDLFPYMIFGTKLNILAWQIFLVVIITILHLYSSA